MFGRVVEGMAILKKIESVGSRSGKTSRKVVVDDCGQLAGRLEMAMRLKAEKVRRPPRPAPRGRPAWRQARPHVSQHC